VAKVYSSIYLEKSLVDRVCRLAGPDYLDRSANYLYVKAVEEWAKKQEAEFGIEEHDEHEDDDGHNSEDV
jgi:hypothetical protein